MVSAKPSARRAPGSCSGTGRTSAVDDELTSERAQRRPTGDFRVAADVEGVKKSAPERQRGDRSDARDAITHPLAREVRAVEPEPTREPEGARQAHRATEIGTEREARARDVRAREGLRRLQVDGGAKARRIDVLPGHADAQA